MRTKRERKKYADKRVENGDTKKRLVMIIVIIKIMTTVFNPFHKNSNKKAAPKLFLLL